MSRRLVQALQSPRHHSTSLLYTFSQSPQLSASMPRRENRNYKGRRMLCSLRCSQPSHLKLSHLSEKGKILKEAQMFTNYGNCQSQFLSSDFQNNSLLFWRPRQTAYNVFIQLRFLQQTTRVSKFLLGITAFHPTKTLPLSPLLLRYWVFFPPFFFFLV